MGDGRMNDRYSWVCSKCGEPAKPDPEHPDDGHLPCRCGNWHRWQLCAPGAPKQPDPSEPGYDGNGSPVW